MRRIYIKVEEKSLNASETILAPQPTECYCGFLEQWENSLERDTTILGRVNNSLKEKTGILDATLALFFTKRASLFSGGRI